MTRSDRRVPSPGSLRSPPSPQGEGSAPPEQLFDIRQLQLDIGRATVAALAGMRCRFHFPEQGIHFIRIETAPGAHAAVAGHGCANVVDPLFKSDGAVEFRQIISKITPTTTFITSPTMMQKVSIVLVVVATTASWVLLLDIHHLPPRHLHHLPQVI